MTSPPILVINLDDSRDRLAYMTGQLAGLDWQRVPGVEGRAGLPAHLQEQFPPSALTDGEVGCYASHLVAMQAVLDSGAPWAFILEDDAELYSHFWLLARQGLIAADQYRPGWDVIHLCAKDIKHWWRRRPTWTVAKLLGNRRLVAYWRRPVRASAYAISAEGARKFLQPRPRTRPVDEEFRATWDMPLKFYGVTPPLSGQNAVYVSITGERPRGRDHRQATLSQRWRGWRRIWDGAM